MKFKSDLRVSVVWFFENVTPWSLDRLEHDLAKAANEESDAVVLHMRSPGGYTFRVEETARLVEKISKEKAIFAYTDVVLASAAYWIAASCDKIYASPSSIVGSIGAYIEIYDFQKYWEKAGIEHSVIRAGDRKARSLDGQFDEQELKEMQNDVNASHKQFIEHVQKHRRIDVQFMQGQCFSGANAFAINMTDGLFDRVEDLVSSLTIGES